MENVEVKIKAGVIKLQEPRAGVRNDALIDAETAQGIKMTKFIVSLIPHMVTDHPFGAQPIETALNNLTIKEYDDIVDAARELVVVDTGDDSKKSKSASN